MVTKSTTTKKKPAAEKAVKKPKQPKPVAPVQAASNRKEFVGVVVSNKMQKTITVTVDRQLRDSRYSKYVVRSKKYKAHDEKNDAKIGDLVRIVETRPLSRDKNWALKEIIRRSRLGDLAEEMVEE